MGERPELRALAERLGIVPSFVGAGGVERVASDATREALLAAMGHDASSEEAAARFSARLDAEEERRLVEPVRVARAGASALATVSVRLPRELEGPCTWHLELRAEDGTAHVSEGSFGSRPTRRLPVPGARELPPGYHTLRLALETPGARREALQRLIATPRTCVAPSAVLGRPRGFGLVANLYTLRSRRNWGVGDFTDLHALTALAGSEGAAFIGLSPLHSLWNRGASVSPYSPVSRLYRNELYLDVEAVPELPHCPEARARLAQPELAEALAALRARDRIDYDGAAARKRELLELLHRCFRERHGGGETARGRDFAAYRAREGQALRDFATFLALAEHLHETRGVPLDWHAWPEPYRDARSESVARFRREQEERIDFHSYVQFELDRQLAGAAARAREAGLSLGLYQDLALGTAGGGCDPWAFAGVFADGASAGAPPDDFNPHGQNWAFPPLHPRRLRERAYDFWIRVLRGAFGHAGALRIDHVMSLSRLYWIPGERPPTEGAYVRYPLEDLVGILALESERHDAVVVGEDLGTVPSGFASQLARWGVLSSRVLYFERRDGDFARPREYSSRALVTANTHDLPPLAGYVTGRDLELRREVGLIGSDDALREEKAEREHTRHALLHRLEAEGLLPAEGGDGAGPTPEELAAAVTAFLCRTPSPLVGLSLDDLVGETEPVNLPGVGQEHFPSWTRRMPVGLEELGDHAVARATFEAVPRGRAAEAARAGSRRRRGAATSSP